MRRHALFWPPVVYHGLLLTLLRQKPTLFLPLRLGLHHGISVWTGHQTSQTISSSTAPDALVPVPPQSRQRKARRGFGLAAPPRISLLGWSSFLRRPSDTRDRRARLSYERPRPPINFFPFFLLAAYSQLAALAGRRAFVEVATHRLEDSLQGAVEAVAYWQRMTVARCAGCKLVAQFQGTYIVSRPARF